jgi:hypothetical protein
METESASETFSFRILDDRQRLENPLEPIEGKSYLVDLDANGTIVINFTEGRYEEMYNSVAGSCIEGNTILDFVEREEFHNQKGSYQLFKLTPLFSQTHSEEIFIFT